MKNLLRRLLKWLGAAKILSLPRKYIWRFVVYYYLNKDTLLISFKNSDNPQVFDLIRQIKKETEMLLSDQEAYLIYSIVRKTQKVKGDIAEVGVYKGGSAKLIATATKKPLHLFDTFSGLPDITSHDNPEQYHKGDYCSSYNDVKYYLQDYPHVFFYRGIFPSTAKPVKNHKFSFVHLDVDLYESTRGCLKFFYPRMNKGAVLISHDYPGSKGVKEAVDEFFTDKPEIIFEPFGTDQCLIVKV